MNNEEIFNDFIHYLKNDIQSKDFLTYQEQDEWKDYLERIINNCTKEKDKEIARLNKIIDELEKDLEYEIKEFEKDGYDLPSVRQQSLWLAGCYDEDKLILQKLKELKEEGKKDE